MSRKNRPQYHEPVSEVPAVTEQTEVVVVEVFDPIEDTIEVGEVILVDGPVDALPLGRSLTDDYVEPSYENKEESTPALSVPDIGAVGATLDTAKDAVTDKAADAAQGVAQAAQDAGDKAQDVVQDVAQSTQVAVKGATDKAKDTAQDIAGKAQDIAQGVADKAQDVAQGVTGKAQDVAQTVTDKAQDVAQTIADKAQDVTGKVADKASVAKAAAGDAVDSAKAAVPAAKGVLGNAASKIGTASASGAQSAGSALWLLFQRNPLQAIFVIASVIWLVRNNKATAAQPPVSITDAAGNAAEKVGTVAGHVQVAATNLTGQVSDQASRSASWFSKTLYENPLAIGAMAIVFGAGLGFSVPESDYENKMLGKKRDELADKVTAAAQDLTQKVTTVAQTAAHDAVESAKAEAKNQGLTAEAAADAAAGAVAPEQPAAQDQPQGQPQDQTPAS